MTDERFSDDVNQPPPDHEDGEALKRFTMKGVKEVLDKRRASEPTPSERLEALVRAIHYHGNPPDVRLEDDVDGDVRDIMAEAERMRDDAVREAQDDADLQRWAAQGNAVMQETERCAKVGQSVRRYYHGQSHLGTFNDGVNAAVAAIRGKV